MFTHLVDWAKETCCKHLQTALETLVETSWVRRFLSWIWAQVLCLPQAVKRAPRNVAITLWCFCNPQSRPEELSRTFIGSQQFWCNPFTTNDREFPTPRHSVVARLCNQSLPVCVKTPVQYVQWSRTCQLHCYFSFQEHLKPHQKRYGPLYQESMKPRVKRVKGSHVGMIKFRYPKLWYFARKEKTIVGQELHGNSGLSHVYQLRWQESLP